MDIVWKNEGPPRQDHRSGLAPALTEAEERGFEATWLQAANKPLRFVQNGAKRRRKTAKLPKDMDQFMTIVPPTPLAGGELSAIPDNDTTPAFIGYDDIVITEGFDESLNANRDNDWTEPNMEFLDSARQTPSSSRSDPYDSPHGFPPHFSDTTMDMDGSDVGWQVHDSGYAMQLYGHGVPQSPSTVANLFPLSPGPLFTGTSQKAAAILDMCELHP